MLELNTMNSHSFLGLSLLGMNFSSDIISAQNLDMFKQNIVWTLSQNCINCKVCENILVVDDDDSVSCDRCEQVLCIECSGLTKSDIEYLAQSQGNMFWYCTTCKDSAVSAVKADKVVEEKCKEFLESFEKSLREKAEHTIKTTCDKYMLTKTKRLEAVEQKLNSTAEARQSSSTTMGTLQANEREGQAIDCLQDRMAHKNNVVFFGVSEAKGSTREDKMADNKAKNVSIASEVGVQLKDEDILSFKRLGKMGQTRMVIMKKSPSPGYCVSLLQKQCL